MKTKICRRIIRRLCHESGSYHLTVLYQNNIEIERKVSDRFVAFVILLHKYQLNESDPSENRISCYLWLSRSSCCRCSGKEPLVGMKERRNSIKGVCFFFSLVKLISGTLRQELFHPAKAQLFIRRTWNQSVKIGGGTVWYS